MEQDPIVIVGARRTPMGAFQGALSGLASTALGAAAIASAMEQAALQSWEVSEVIMGCVLSAGWARRRRGRRRWAPALRGKCRRPRLTRCAGRA